MGTGRDLRQGLPPFLVDVLQKPIILSGEIPHCWCRWIPQTAPGRVVVWGVVADLGNGFLLEKVEEHLTDVAKVPNMPTENVWGRAAAKVSGSVNFWWMWDGGSSRPVAMKRIGSEQI